MYFYDIKTQNRVLITYFNEEKNKTNQQNMKKDNKYLKNTS